MHLLGIFLSFNLRKKGLCIEAFFSLFYYLLLKHLPFINLRQHLGQHKQESSYNMSNEHKQKMMEVKEMLYIITNHMLWGQNCLIKALACRKMLLRRGIDHTIYLATAKDEEGNLIAHAWLRSGPYDVTGAEGKENFTIVTSFANIVKGSI